MTFVCTCSWHHKLAARIPWLRLWCKEVWRHHQLGVVGEWKREMETNWQTREKP